MGIISAKVTLALLAAGSSAATNGVFEQQLRSQYVLTQMGRFGKVSAAGTVVVIQQDGLNAGPSAATMWYLNSFKDGQRKKGGMREAMYQNAGTLRAIQVGERFYISKLEVKDGAVTFYLISCEQTGGKAGVSFQFAKGFQTSLAFPDIQQAVGQVFTTEGQNNQNAQPAQVASQPPPAEPVARPAPQAPPAEPTRIELGQTIEQVVAALGQPGKIVNLGEKQMYMYKDLKITFLNGKVSDVQ
jgi:hypothetical protein